MTDILDNNGIFELASNLPDGGLHFRYDPETGLRAIIAIHDTTLGPALGGCRWLHYARPSDAIIDAMRLAKGMTYKAAISDIPTGGGKTVLLRPDNAINKQKYFKSYAEFIQQLGGQYITAVDSGTSLEEMDIVAQYTPYVASLTTKHGFSHGDPAPYTAMGVRHGIEAAVAFKFGSKDLSKKHIAIQGVGSVGHFLVKELLERGAKVTICDVNTKLAQTIQQKFKVSVVDAGDIYGVNSDVFVPCALGAILNDATIPLLKAKIVAGAANNQLALERHGDMLRQNGVLYAPDFVINAGGLIYAYALYSKDGEGYVMQKISKIHDTLQSIFIEAQDTLQSTSVVANQIAERILLAHKK